MSYNLLPASSLWQLKLCRKFDSKLTSTGRVICHLCRDPVSFSHRGNSDPVNLREILANCFHKFCREPSKRSQTARPLRDYTFLPRTQSTKGDACRYRCVTYGHDTAEVSGVGGGSHVNVEEEWDVDRALSTSSLWKWRHRSEPLPSQLPHGGWQWSPRMNTSLIKANEAFFASSACAEKNNGAPPPPRGSHSTHLECRERVEMAKKEGRKKKK